MSKQPMDDNGRTFPVLFPGTASTVSIASASAQSSAFASTTKVIEIRASKACYISIAANPTATSSTTYLPADETRYYGVTPGHKIAVIRVSEDGTLYITQGA